MCGIVGLHIRNGSIEDLRSSIAEMVALVQHRGPDHAGIHVSDLTRTALGYSRLSFNGLGRAGNQPVHRKRHGVSLVFNGEIYNFRELQREYQLEETTSDSQTLADLWCLAGKEVLPRLRGMFSFAVLDERRKKLSLCRDRYGMKPLFVQQSKATIAFASEPQLLTHGGVSPRALAQYVRRGHLDIGSSGFVGVEELLPGECREITLNEYLDVASTFYMERGFEDIPPMRLANLQTVVDESVRAHLISETEVGLLLSDGFDSALIASSLRRLGAPVRAVTITTDDDRDLAAGSQATARYYGIDLHIAKVDYSEELLDEFFSSMRLPTVDGLNTFVASSVLNSLGLRGCITGLGGDEIFYGYRSSSVFVSLFYLASILPNHESLLGRVEDTFAKRLRKWQRVLLSLSNLTARNIIETQISTLQPDQVRDLTSALPTENWLNSGLCESPLLSNASGGLNVPYTFWRQAIMDCYLRPRLLRDGDFFSMSRSVELRFPFVDSKLRSSVLAIGAGLGHKLDKSATARMLGDTRLLELARRKKSGFNVFGGLRTRATALRPYIERVRSPDSAVSQYLGCDPSLLRGLVDPCRPLSAPAWSLVCLNEWLSRNG